MDYPFIGRRMEVIKNCSVLADCSFIGAVMCSNIYGFVNSCSIQCCTGDLCNNKTFQYTTTSTTPTNYRILETRVNITSTVMQNNATRIPHKTPEITLSSSLSLSRNSMSSEKALTSRSSATTAWTSQKSQVAIFSSAPPVIEPTVGVSTGSGDAEKISVSKLTVLMPMTVLVSGINYDRF